MFLRRIAIAALLFAGYCGAYAECKMEKAASFKILVEDNRIVVPGMINGRPVQFLVDTGFPTSVIISSAARNLGLHVRDFMPDQPGSGSYLNTNAGGAGANTGAMVGNKNGETKSNKISDMGQVAIEDMQLDGRKIQLKFLTVGAMRENFGQEQLIALLGDDFWSQFDVEIDVRNKIINLYHPQDCAGNNPVTWSQHYNVVEMSRYGRQRQFKGKLNGETVTAVLDTGSPYTTLVSRTARRSGAARRENSDPLNNDIIATDFNSMTRLTQGLSLINNEAEIKAADHTNWIAVADNFVLDSENVTPAMFHVVPDLNQSLTVGSRISKTLDQNDIALGAEFLWTHHVLIANSQSKLYFTYEGPLP